jgi:hypothetical protein
VKYIPDWFPGASFKLKLKIWRQELADMVNKPFEIALDRIVRRIAHFMYAFQGD